MSAIAPADIGQQLRSRVRGFLFAPDREIGADFALTASNGVDSLVHVELVMAAEDICGIDIPDALAVDIKTFGDLERVCAELMQAKARGAEAPTA